MTDDVLKAAFAADMVFLRNCGIHPVVVHGGGPQISAMLKQARHRRRFQGRLPGHHARGARRRADGAVRSGRPRTGRPDQRARPVRGRHHRRGRPPVHRGAAQRRSSTAWPPTSAWSATSSRSTPRRCWISLPRAAFRWSRPSRPTPTGVVHNINADTAAAALAEALGAEKLLMLTDVEGPLHRLARPRLAGQRDRRRRADADCCRRWSRAWCPRSRPACARSTGGVPSAHVIDGRVEHCVLVELFTDEGTGHEGGDA